MTLAAVMEEIGKPLTIKHVELGDLQPNEVKIKLHYSGVCHTDVSALQGKLGINVPAILGHEGAGMITEVGSNVNAMASGDPVILTYIRNCGNCIYCRSKQPFLCMNRSDFNGAREDGSYPILVDGKPCSRFLGLSAFSEETIVQQNSVIPINKGIDLAVAALVGCGVATGVGAVLNTAKVEAGSTVLVFGCGGVGLNVIQAAKIAGAAKIIAVDIYQSKLELAEKFGATQLINANKEDLLSCVMKITNQIGADYAFENVGQTDIFEQCVSLVRNRGKIIMVGFPGFTTKYQFPAAQAIRKEINIIGCIAGSNNPVDDFKKYLDYYSEGVLNLDDLVTKKYKLEKINDIFEEMKTGKLARGVIRF